MSLQTSHHWGLCTLTEAEGRYTAPTLPEAPLSPTLVLTLSGDILVRKGQHIAHDACVAALVIDPQAHGLTTAQSCAMPKLWNMAMAFSNGKMEAVTLYPLAAHSPLNVNDYKPAEDPQLVLSPADSAEVSVRRRAARGGYVTVFHNAGGSA